MVELILFYIFAVIAVISAVAVVSVRNPVHSAVYLIVTLLQVAAIFVLLRAPFLAAVQVFIYVGAVMVLFLFAVMVLNIGRERVQEHIHAQGPFAVVAAVAFFILMALTVFKGKIPDSAVKLSDTLLGKNTEVLGKLLYTKYIFPFEVVSLLLLIALVGAIVLVMNEKRKGS
jgi:NADH-quinone oxidoreductase subunit J